MKSYHLTTIFENTAGQYPGKTFLYFNNERYNYKETRDNIDAYAVRFKELNIEGYVVVMLKNSPRFIFTVFALSKIGALPIPVNFKFTRRELDEIVQGSNARFVISEDDSSIQITSIDMNETFQIQYDSFRCKPFTQFKPREETDNALMFFTSGSTGKMKGVIHSFKSLCSNSFLITDLMGIDSQDIYYICVPLFHLFGFSPGILTAIISGASIVLSDTLGSLGVLEQIQKHNVSVLLCNATMLKQLIDLQQQEEYGDLRIRLTMVSGSISPPGLFYKGMDVFSRGLLNLYGATETGIISQTFFSDTRKKRAETVGKPLQGVEIKITDDSNNDVGNNNIGEVKCRTFSLFKEYYNQPEATSRVKDSEGWYSTGDSGFLDEEGYLKIVGRKNEMIIKSGFNIYPREVELVLLANDKIKEAVVIGIPDAVYGEKVKAFVVLKDNMTSTPWEIKKICSLDLVSYKVPDQIMFVRELPRTATGKIKKSDLIQ